jgi:hypothetical protein
VSLVRNQIVYKLTVDVLIAPLEYVA